MKAEEKPRRKGGRSLDIRSNIPSSRAIYGAMPAAALIVLARPCKVISSTRDIELPTPSSGGKDGSILRANKSSLRQPAGVHRGRPGYQFGAWAASGIGV